MERMSALPSTFDAAKRGGGVSEAWDGAGGTTNKPNKMLEPLPNLATCLYLCYPYTLPTLYECLCLRFPRRSPPFTRKEKRGNPNPEDWKLHEV